MKKIIAFALLLVIIYTGVGCEKKNIGLNNTVSVAQLTAREMVFLSSASEQYAVFDFKTDEKYNHLTVGIEKYEYGKKTDYSPGEISTEIKGNGTIVFAKAKGYGDLSKNQAIFNISIDNNGSLSTGTVMDEVFKNGESNVMSTWAKNEEKNIPVSDKVILSGYCIAGAGRTGMSSLSSDFYNGYENKLDELKDYSVVYLLKCEFTKK